MKQRVCSDLGTRVQIVKRTAFLKICHMFVCIFIADAAACMYCTVYMRLLCIMEVFA